MIDPKKIFGRLGNSMFQYAYIYAQVRKGIIPDVFLQDPSHFDEYREEIRQLYQVSREPIDMVAIHVRRGTNPINPEEPKYCENPFYVNLMETPYYQDAMVLFPDEDFLVFSDDIGWCKEQKIFKDCEFSEGKTELEDMEMMANCKGVIMANSSFSWWASYLSNAKVVAPKSWYADGIIRTKLLPEWQAI